MNKYQKANEFIRLSEEQKESIVANLLREEEPAPARKPFFLKPWMAGLGVAFAVLVLYFGMSHRASAPMPAPVLQQTTASEAAEDSAAAAGEEAGVKTEFRSENEVNSFMDTQGTVPEAAANQSGTRIIFGKEAEEIDPSSYGEKREIVVLDTEVSVYGNRAAVFVCGGQTVAVVSGEELSEEELNTLITSILRDFGN